MNHARSAGSVYGARPFAQCPHRTTPDVTDFLQIAQLGISYSPHKLPFRTQLPNEIAGAGFHLFMERYRWDKPIRAVTIRGIDLVSQKDAEQLSMFVDHQKRDRRILLEDAVEDIRRRFGKRAISYAILMGDLKIPDDGRQLVTMPGLMYQ